MSTWRRSLPSRAAARLVTGPVGHLVAGVIDWLVLLTRFLYARVRGRDPWQEYAAAGRKRARRKR